MIKLPLVVETFVESVADHVAVLEDVADAPSSGVPWWVYVVVPLTSGVVAGLVALFTPLMKDHAEKRKEEREQARRIRTRMADVWWRELRDCLKIVREVGSRVEMVQLADSYHLATPGAINTVFQALLDSVQSVRDDLQDVRSDLPADAVDPLDAAMGKCRDAALVLRDAAREQSIKQRQDKISGLLNEAQGIVTFEQERREKFANDK